MYGTACDQPRIPRLIVTGYRMQDVLGYAAGGSAYLLKPFTKQSLREQIRKASVLHCVKWLCPEEIQIDYSSLLNGELPFANCANWLKHWLAYQRIGLDIITQATKDKIAGSDLIVIDIFKSKDGRPVLDLLDTISQIRYVNNHASLIVVIPTATDAEDLVSDCYRKMPLALRDGSDMLIKKPMWLVADGSAIREEVLGKMIISQLRLFNDYDTKYQILVPVAAIVGRCNAAFVCRINDKSPKPAEEWDELYAPLLPFLINAYGLSGRLKDIAESPNLCEDLKERVLRAYEQEKYRWVSMKEEEVKNETEKMVERFVKAVKDNSIQHHMSVEAWLRKIVDNKPKEKDKEKDEDKDKDIHSLTEPLARVFGGSTRYEFSVRGSWYQDIEQRVDDILIVVEFCAKSSIIAKRFIENTVVDYLHKVAGEKCVFVQEIPIRGSFFSNSSHS